MIVKSFTAPTVAEALKKIKEELGGDAIVLKTSVCPTGESVMTGHRVEVTACIDEHLARNPKVGVNANDNLEEESRVAGDNEEALDLFDANDNRLAEKFGFNETADPGNPSVEYDDDLSQVYHNLIDSDLSESIAERITEAASDQVNHGNYEFTAYEILKSNLNIITSTDIRIEKGMRVAFVGPSGSGKSSVMSKVAAQLCSRFKQKVKLTTIDNSKLSAKQEMNAYGKMLDLPVELIGEMTKMKKDREDAILLIDTQPIDCYPENRNDLLARMDTIKPDLVFLILSARSRTNDLVDSVNSFKEFQPDFLVMTHLDETRRWGGLMTMAECLDIPVAFVTDQPGGKGELILPDASIIAQNLLAMEDSNESGFESNDEGDWQSE